MSYVIAKYLRISDEDVDLDGLEKHESNSISGQRALLDDFIRKTTELSECEAIEVVEVIEVIDDGFTGTNFSRDGVRKIIQMAQDGKVQCIIVKDLSRWGRNYIEVGDFLEQKFPAWGVRFISVGDGYDSAKLNHGVTGIDIAFRNLIYDLYSQDLSVKCRSGKDAATKSGKIICTYPTFGYDKDKNDRHKFVIDPQEAPIVKRIFDLAEQGHKVADIVKILNNENVPTKQMSKHRKGFTHKWGRGDCWDYSAVIDTLRNECYTGKWIYGKTRVAQIGTSRTKKVPRSEWIVIPDAIPALITEAQFIRVQERLNAVFRGTARRIEPEQPRTIFAKLVKCAMCDRMMDFSSRKAKTGYFFCKMPKRSDKYGCLTDKIEENDLALIVLAALKQQVALTDLEQSAKNIESANVLPIKNILANMQNIKRLIEQARSTKITLWESYHGNNISQEKFQKESDKITKQISEYETMLKELHNQAEEAKLQKDYDIKHVRKLGSLLGIQALTRELVLEFVNEIKVYTPERIEIIWKHGDCFPQKPPAVSGKR